MKGLKKILVILLVVFIAVQFIQPAHNNNGQILPTNIGKIVNVPDGVLTIFENACYDCHSNSTRYPWYVYLQPVGWMLAGHVKNGKINLNFSEFGSYSTRKQANKLRAIATSIEESSMPLPAYEMMHKTAKLSDGDKKLIMDWALKTKVGLMQK